MRTRCSHISARLGGFSIIELLVAIAIVAIGLAALVRLFEQTITVGGRSEIRTQAWALGMGTVARWQARSRADVLADLARADSQHWPPNPQPYPPPFEKYRWQWRWSAPLPEQGPLSLTLQVSTDWLDEVEIVEIPALL